MPACSSLLCVAAMPVRACCSRSVSAALLGRAECVPAPAGPATERLYCAGTGGQVYCHHVTPPCDHVKCLLLPWPVMIGQPGCVAISVQLPSGQGTT